MSLPTKVVTVIAEDLPVGVALNTAALLGIGLGHHAPGLVGGESRDASGRPHLGMSTHAVPVLKASADQLRELYDQAAAHPGLLVADMNQVAQESRTYDAFLASLDGTKPEDLRYLGLMILGPRQTVESLTGRLALYR
jgi:hypothetical protein